MPENTATHSISCARLSAICIEPELISVGTWGWSPATVVLEFFEHRRRVDESLFIIRGGSVELSGKAPPQGMCLLGQVRIMRLLIFVHGDAHV